MSEPRFCETTPYALSALLVYFFSFPIVNPNIDLWDGNFRKITQKQLSYLTTHRRRVGSERTAKPWSGEHSASVHGPQSCVFRSAILQRFGSFLQGLFRPSLRNWSSKKVTLPKSNRELKITAENGELPSSNYNVTRQAVRQRDWWAAPPQVPARALARTCFFDCLIYFGLFGFVCFLFITVFSWFTYTYVCRFVCRFVCLCIGPSQVPRGPGEESEWWVEAVMRWALWCWEQTPGPLQEQPGLSSCLLPSWRLTDVCLRMVSLLFWREGPEQKTIDAENNVQRSSMSLEVLKLLFFLP